MDMILVICRWLSEKRDEERRLFQWILCLVRCHRSEIVYDDYRHYIDVGSIEVLYLLREVLIFNVSQI